MDPAHVGPFRVVGRLGEGGMGAVYRAVDPVTGDAVAVKIPRTAEVSVAAFREEVRALSRVRHPQVVRILAEGVEGTLPWYAMELVEGETLREYNAALWGHTHAPNASAVARDDATWTGDEGVHEPHAIPSSVTRRPAAAGRLREVLTLFRRLCVPLGELHGHGIVHRDLKPANVILRADGTPLLMDFGVASWFRGAVGRERLELVGAVVGTLTYMAPEQALGQPVDARADLYSLGCMLYECVTGRPPFLGHSVTDLVARVVSEAPRAPSDVVDGVPDALDALILALLAKSRGQRLGYADDVAEVLGRLGAEEADGPVTARPYLYRAEVVGRECELAALDAQIERAAGAGAVVLVGGESGVGKTSLVVEAAMRACGRQLRVVVGECLPVVSEPSDATRSGVAGAPFHPFVPLLQAIGDHCRRHGAEAAARVLGDRGARLAPYEPSLGGLAPDASPPDPEDLPADLVQQRLHEALRDTLAAWIGEVGAVLLLLDDLHWADDLSLAWIKRCVHEPVPGLLLVGTWRSEQVGPALQAVLDERGATRIELTRLDRANVGRLVADMLAMPAGPPSLVAALDAVSHGNPFFVAEYLRMAIAEGLLQREHGHWTFHPRTETVTLPEPRSIRELVARRLAGLRPELRALLEAASVLGREFSTEHLRALHPIEEGAADELLRELVERQILQLRGEGCHRFLHDKLREAAYEGIDVARRRTLHRRAAGALEASPGDAPAWALLARHWREAEAWSKAVDCLDRAGEQAQRTYANRDVVAHFEEALRLSARVSPPIDPLRLGRWEWALAEAHVAWGDLVACQTHARRALRHLGEPSLPSGSVRQAARLLREVLVRQVQTHFQELFVARDPDQQRRLRKAALVYSRLLEPFMQSNQPILGIWCGVRTVNLAERIAPSPALARGYAGMALVVGVIPPLRGVSRRWADRAVEVAESLRSEDALSYALCRGTGHYHNQGEWDVTLARYDRAAEIAARLGDQRRLDEARTIRATVWNTLGRFAESVEGASVSLTSAIGRGDLQAETWTRALLLEGHARLGRNVEAAAHIGPAQAHLDALTAAERLQAHTAIAIASLLAGERARAREAATRAVEDGESAPLMAFFLASAVCVLAEVCFALWRDARTDAGAPAALARRALAHVETCARFVPFATPMALLWRGAWAGRDGRVARARRLLRRAIEGAERFDLQHVEGTAWVELARLAHGPERATYVARAVTRFAACGAVVDRERARRLLAE